MAAHDSRERRRRSRREAGELRGAIGIVPQDTVLFNDTIYYNTQYGRPDAPRET
jgi:ABC-type transport system involved in Fe-S cluster assembly fused permease/ATPase subunit